MTDTLDHRWRRLCVWRGLGLGNWLRLLRLGPSIDASGLPLALSLSVTSPLNSAMSLAESLVFARRVSRVSLHESPIFILGHWRSGTTLLHNLLTLDPQFAFINHYQSFFPNHFLLTERLATTLASRAVPSTRPMDGMSAGWQLPQEDEMAMLLLTLQSPYLYAAFPDQPDVYRKFANLQRALTDEQLEHWKETLLRLLRKAAYQQGRTRFVLKSPTHTTRIPILKTIFPNARYVHIVRNPYDVYASTLRLRRSMAEINSFSRRRFVDLESEVLDDYMTVYHAYHMHRALLDRSHIHEIRYEDLVDDPIGSVEAIYQSFELPGFDELKPRVEALLPSIRRHRTMTKSLSAEDRAMIAERWGPAFRRYGYAIIDPNAEH